MVLFPGLKEPSKGRREEGKKKGGEGGTEGGKKEAIVLRFECEMAPTGSALSYQTQQVELLKVVES